jgi:hypothetical protein
MHYLIIPYHTQKKPQHYSWSLNLEIFTLRRQNLSTIVIGFVTGAEVCYLYSGLLRLTQENKVCFCQCII